MSAGASRNGSELGSEIVNVVDGERSITADAAGLSVEYVDAICCGALGCHEQEPLIRVTIETYGTRVLCTGHLADLLDREVCR